MGLITNHQLNSSFNNMQDLKLLFLGSFCYSNEVPLLPLQMNLHTPPHWLRRVFPEFFTENNPSIQGPYSLSFEPKAGEFSRSSELFNWLRNLRPVRENHPNVENRFLKIQFQEQFCPANHESTPIRDIFFTTILLDLPVDLFSSPVMRIGLTSKDP